MDRNTKHYFLTTLALLLLGGIGSHIYLWHDGAGSGSDDPLMVPVESGKSEAVESRRVFDVLDHDLYVHKADIRTQNLTQLNPGPDPLATMWTESSRDELRLLAALGRADIPVTESVRSLVKLSQQDADKQVLLAFIDEHFKTLDQLPYRAATLEWLLVRYPELSPAQSSSRQNGVISPKLVDEIQSVKKER